MGRSYTVGSVFGTPIIVSPRFIVSCLICVPLFSVLVGHVNLEIDAFSSLTVGLASAVIYGASIFLHEFAHLLVLQRSGIGAASVTLAFGGVTRARQEITQPKVAFLVHASGPACTLLLAGMGLVAFIYLRSLPDLALLKELMLVVFAINGIYMIPGVAFPVFPSDANQILRTVVWMLTGDAVVAATFAARAGFVFLGALFLVSLFLIVHPFFLHSDHLGLALILCGLEYFFLSRKSRRRAIVSDDGASDILPG
jgi:Zn-dependent protease